MRILSNTHLPINEPHLLKTFADYIPDLYLSTPERSYQRYSSLSDVLDKVSEHEFPEAVIISSPEYLPVPEDLAAFSGPKVLLITDWNVCIRFLEDLCPLFDYCFTDSTGVEILRSWGLDNVYHQPLFGHNPRDFRLLDPEPREETLTGRKYDISFCGNFNFNLHRERDCRLFDFSRLAGKFNIYIGQVFGRDYINLLNRSRLVWNYSVRSEANKRCFEAMACGAIPLIEAGNREMPMLFEAGRHYLEYGLHTLEQTVSGILANPDRLFTMQRDALEAVASHTGARQMDALLTFVCQQQGQNMTTGPGTGKAGFGTASRLEPRNLKSVVKTNMLGGAFLSDNLAQVLSPRCEAMPGLEREMMPGIVISKIEENIGQGLPVESLRNHLENRFLADSGMPDVLNHYFQFLLHESTADHEKSTGHAEACLNALRELMKEDGDVNTRRSIYEYLIPPLSYHRAFANDVSVAIINDRNSGKYLMICELLKDNCLKRLAETCLQKGDTQKARIAAEDMSGHNFLSSPAVLVRAKVSTALGERKSLVAAMGALFNFCPVNYNYWPVILDGLVKIQELDLLKQYLKVFNETAQTVFHQNRELLDTLIKAQKSIAY
ncbi:glycosyltransferase [Fibrobacterota bacterium]